MAEKHERVKKVANNERSVQSQTLRTIFLSHKNPETQLVSRVKPGEHKANDDDDEPLATPDIKALGVREVSDLRKLLFSRCSPSFLPWHGLSFLHVVLPSFLHAGGWAW
jgi:hypothetical protein